MASTGTRMPVLLPFAATVVSNVALAVLVVAIGSSPLVDARFHSDRRQPRDSSVRSGLSDRDVKSPRHSRGPAHCSSSLQPSGATDGTAPVVVPRSGRSQTALTRLVVPISHGYRWMKWKRLALAASPP